MAATCFSSVYRRCFITTFKNHFLTPSVSEAADILVEVPDEVRPVVMRHVPLQLGRVLAVGGSGDRVGIVQMVVQQDRNQSHSLTQSQVTEGASGTSRG